MEFKDKLKKIRTEKGITQLELAKAIFVSRSAVAKWENGHGLPSEESRQALCEYFAVESSFFDTDEPEQIIVEKNKKIDTRDRIIAAIAYVVAVFIILSFLLSHFGFALSSRSAVAGLDWPVIDTFEYDFYISVPDNDDGTGFIRSVYAVQQFGPWYVSVDSDRVLSLDTADGTHIGDIYCHNGWGRTYCFYISAWERVEGPSLAFKYLYLTDEITINGEVIELYRGSYFVLSEDIETVEILGQEVQVSVPEWSK